MAPRQRHREETEAPTYTVEDRTIVAVEHPMLLRNLDAAVKTFGNNRPFERIMDTSDPGDCVPLYLAYQDPMAAPILSHHAISNNVLLKVTVPKRTGRKRKRGTQNPWEDATTQSGSTSTVPVTDSADNQLNSHSGLDDPKVILRKLKDNADKYQIETVGELNVTHRYRGMHAYHHSVENNEFYNKFRNTVLTGHAEDIRKFKFDGSMGWKPGQEIIPGPSAIFHPLPFLWNWTQNTNIHEEVDGSGKTVLINRSKPQGTSLVYLAPTVERIPDVPPHEMPDDPHLENLVDMIKEAMEVRPMWTRRALLNHLAEYPHIHLFKPAIQYAGYQFRGGPFRDAIIKYGLDPRKDPKYRIYQTLFFKAYQERKVKGAAWTDVRTAFSIVSQRRKDGLVDSHLFDGKKVTLDGKVWQCCDITDPLLADLIKNAPIKSPMDSADGYFTNGSISKIKAIMRTKITAIRAGKKLQDEDFMISLQIPDLVPEKRSLHVYVPVPDVLLSDDEVEAFRAQGLLSVVHANGIQKSKYQKKARNKRIVEHINGGPSKPRKNMRKKKYDIGEHNKTGDKHDKGDAVAARPRTPSVGVFLEPSRAGSVFGGNLDRAENRLEDVFVDSDGNEIDMETSEEGDSVGAARNAGDGQKADDHDGEAVDDDGEDEEGRDEVEDVEEEDDEGLDNDEDEDDAYLAAMETIGELGAPPTPGSKDDSQYPDTSI